ncbi:hypothetical protein ACTXML_17335 [Glutamicibacter arilaitensis]|uniref:hypothetical protein n=1 Tax=Glutamicibacter arilaitensis TaxID=256701 RepID=UPI003FD13B4D
MIRSERRENAISLLKNVKYYESLEMFKTSFEPKSQIGTIIQNNVPVDFLFSPSSSKRLSVYFNSQQKPGDLKLFTWQRVSKEFGVDRLFISDPNLYFNENLLLSWYVGNSLLNVQSFLHEMISHVVDLGAYEEIIFFGSSGGGYPAMLLSQQFSNSLAFTLAPATTVLHHYDQKKVSTWLQACFEAGSIDEASDSGRLDNLILDLPGYFMGNLINPVIILQNRNDIDFIECHSKPIARSVDVDFTSQGAFGNNLFISLEEYGKGHLPPPSDRILQVAKVISEIPVGKFYSTNFKELLKLTGTNS